jgi:branched-chain amino acid transport system substrate-binding protein
MNEAANLKDRAIPMLLPGIRINTSPNNFYPIRSAQRGRLQGRFWELFGEIVAYEAQH